MNQGRVTGDSPEDSIADWSNERGAVLAEYGLLLGLIFAVCFAAIGLIGQEVKAFFEAFVF